jgi:hypothetical protein
VAEGIVVDRPLAVDLLLPPATSSTMYSGRLDGKRAVFTRSGGRLDISLPSEEGVRVVGFRSGVDRIDQRMYLNGDGYRGDREGMSPAELSIKPDHIEDPLAYGLSFHIFIHDDLRAYDAADLHARFTAWWIDDVFSVLPNSSKLTLQYYLRVPWISDMDYEHDDVLDRFAHALRLIAPHMGWPYGKTYKHKFMLLTALPAIPNVSGLAIQGQSEATASVQGRLSVVAHEFGHTLGATHEAAGSGRFATESWSLLNWYQCDSNMHPVAPSVYSCMRYTDANERAIRSYMRHGPVAERPDRWLD